MSKTKARINRIALRDGWWCWLCGEPIDPELSMGHIHRASADRVIPGSQGGTYRMDNVRLAHQSCNSYRAQFDHPGETPFAPFDVHALPK